MEKQVAYGEAIGSKREITAMMKDVGVIAVERKEITHQIGAALQTKVMQKKREGDLNRSARALSWK